MPAPDSEDPPLIHILSIKKLHNDRASILLLRTIQLEDVHPHLADIIVNAMSVWRAKLDFLLTAETYVRNLIPTFQLHQAASALIRF